MRKIALKTVNGFIERNELKFLPIKCIFCASINSHRTTIRTGTTPCYILDLVCSWSIVEKAKNLNFDWCAKMYNLDQSMLTTFLKGKTILLTEIIKKVGVSFFILLFRLSMKK